MNFLIILILLLSSSSCFSVKKRNTFLPKKITGEGFVVNKVHRRSPTFWTQGIFYSDGGNHLYESGGEYGKSALIQYKLPSFTISKKVNLSSNFFAEGVAKCGKYVYQLTWKERTILKYAYPGLEYVDKLPMDSRMQEGWGLSNFSHNELVASDGSDVIYILDCGNDLKVKRTIRIKDGDFPVLNINALCYANGAIYANIYLKNKIVRINPYSGQVEKIYDMTNLVTHELKNKTLTRGGYSNGHVLNGIAYNNRTKVFLITGKKWGHFYEVVFS
jgi:glutamine cyclotransferase